MSTSLPKEPLRAIFADLTGLSPERVVWSGEPKGWAGPTENGKTGHLVLDLLATRALGVDEELREYTSEGTKITVSGHRVRTVQVRAENYEDEGFDLLEDLRLKLGLDDTCARFNACGLAFNSTQNVINVGGSAGNRATFFASIDVLFNETVSRTYISTDQGDTYIDTVDVAGADELAIAGEDTIGPP